MGNLFICRLKSIQSQVALQISKNLQLPLILWGHAPCEWTVCSCSQFLIRICRDPPVHTKMYQLVDANRRSFAVGHAVQVVAGPRTVVECLVALLPFAHREYCLSALVCGSVCRLAAHVGLAETWGHRDHPLAAQCPLPALVDSYGRMNRIQAFSTVLLIP